MFMLASGLAFGIVTLRSLDRYTSISIDFWTRVNRYISLLVIGIFLHLPFFSYHKIVESTDPNIWTRILSFDALHLIGAGLLLLQIITLVLKRKSWLLWTSVLIIVVLLTLSPYLWSHDLSGQNALIQVITDPSSGSLFPIFPWLTYIMFGFLIALYLNGPGVYPTESRLRRLALIGVATMCISGAIHFVDAGSFSYFGKLHWNVNPLVILFKGGALCALLAVFYKLENLLIGLRGTGSIGLIEKAANQTLAIYVVHLLLLYGSPLNIGARTIIGAKSMTLLLTLLFTFFFTLFVIALGVLWGSWKRNPKIPEKRLKLGVTLVLLISFLTRTF